MWRNSRLTTPQKRQSDCRRLGHSRLRVASRFTLRIGLASWQTQPPSHAKIAGGPPSLGVHEPSDSPQVTSCHSGTPLCDRPKLTKLSTRALCKLWAEHYWTCPLFLAFLAQSNPIGGVWESLLLNTLRRVRNSRGARQHVQRNTQPLRSERNSYLQRAPSIEC
jgi:hypothetical protein